MLDQLAAWGPPLLSFATHSDRQGDGMKTWHSVIVVVIMLMLLGLASVGSAWATPEQSPYRQSVPTQTPKVPTPVPQPPKEDKNTPVPPTATVEPTRLPQTLPVAGTVSPLSPWGPIVVGALLAAVGWLIRCQAK
jgi:hypothetical protein